MFSGHCGSAVTYLPEPTLFTGPHCIRPASLPALPLGTFAGYAATQPFAAPALNARHITCVSCHSAFTHFKAARWQPYCLPCLYLLIFSLYVWFRPLITTLLLYSIILPFNFCDLSLLILLLFCARDTLYLNCVQDRRAHGMCSRTPAPLRRCLFYAHTSISLA